MSCQISHENGMAIVALIGEVDLEESPAVRKSLLECVGLKTGVIVDMSGVTYIDSSGVASLVEAFQLSRKNSTRFALAAVSPGALRVLELARLDRVFSLYPTVADGITDAV